MKAQPLSSCLEDACAAFVRQPGISLFGEESLILIQEGLRQAVVVPAQETTGGPATLWGMATYTPARPDRPYARLCVIETLPDAPHGVGTALLTEVARQLQATGCTAIMPTPYEPEHENQMRYLMKKVFGRAGFVVMEPPY